MRIIRRFWCRLFHTPRRVTGCGNRHNGWYRTTCWSCRRCGWYTRVDVPMVSVDTGRMVGEVAGKGWT